MAEMQFKKKRNGTCLALLVTIYLLMYTSESVSGQQYTLMQRITSDSSTSWYSSTVRQLEMTPVIDSRDMTIFVPNDGAYNSLSSGKKNTLNFYLNILYYVFLQHLAIDRVYPTSKLRDGLVLPAGIGNYIFVNTRENGAEREVWVNGAKIIKKDLKARNGYIHIIDKVLFPPSSSVSRLLSIDSTLQRAQNLLGAAVRKLPKGFTLFLPTDSAFQKLLPTAYELLSKDSQKAKVRF